MVSGWTSIIDLTDEGQDVSDALDSAFGNLDLTVADVATNTADIATLNGPQTSLEATGSVPAVVLNVENGGAASTVETTYDNGTTTHVVSTIQWLAGENEADWIVDTT